MRRLGYALTLSILLSSCGGPLSLLTGGGPNVAANVQAGKTNNQTVGASENREVSLDAETIGTVKQDSGNSKVKADEVGTVQVNETQPWIILLLILGWLLPSPTQMGSWFLKPFQKKK